jgi:hypothetical protein
MAKTYRNLYPQVWAFGNLYTAWRQARKGKRGTASVAAFEFDLEGNLLALQAELRDKRYTPGGYRTFHIHEPKRRLIAAAPFRDRVVHHALCNVIEPLLERGFIHDSYANRVGKGSHRALDRCTHFMRRYRYVLPCDVRQFFPSIDHAILLAILERRIADGDVRWLIERIVASGAGLMVAEYEPVYYPGDDLFAICRARGLPIGNLTSQFWANVYLNELDQFVKRQLGCQGYLRYVDDLLLFADDSRQLIRWRAAVIEKLAELRLALHEQRAQARPVTEGVPYLGFVVYPDHRRLKAAKVVAWRRRFASLRRVYGAGMLDLAQMNASVLGWVNHARYGDTLGLRRAILAAAPIRPLLVNRAA